MGLVQEFKTFALRGNVMDMAVGVIIGGAFGKIISSVVADIIMPPIGMLLGNVSFSDLSVTLNKAAVSSGAEPVLWKYGSFIQNCIDFLILALCVFFMVKLMNMAAKKKAEEPAAPAAPSKEEVLLTEIRDAIKEKK